jgi:hypothetical protein
MSARQDCMKREKKFHIQQTGTGKNNEYITFNKSHHIINVL